MSAAAILACGPTAISLCVSAAGIDRPVKERPILMSGEMVRAILDGRKTQTRRMIKHQPPFGCKYSMNGAGTHALCYMDNKSINDVDVWVPPTAKSTDHRLPCPFSVKQLWVKETFSAHGAFGSNGRIAYRADARDGKEPNGLSWKPSIYMPRSASRINLEIAKISVERLNDISESDAIAEGVRLKGSTRWAYQAREEYQNLWERINGAGSWALNPYVWVLTFKRV